MKMMKFCYFLAEFDLFLGQSTYLSYRFLKYNTTSFLLAHQNERRTTRTVKTQTKIRYDHSGVSKPTWKSECQFGHAPTLVSAFRNYQQKLWCKRLWCQEAVWDMQQWGEAKSLKMFSIPIQALVINRATGAQNIGQILFYINLRLRVLKGIMFD